MISVPKPDGYFGRDDEWKYLDKHITATDRSRHLVYVYGAGGVGKTALIDLVSQAYSGRSADLIVLDTIDFDDLTLRLPVNFMERIARQLEAEVDESPLREFWRLYGEDTGRDLARRGRRQDEMREAFIAGVGALAAQKRLVILIDTLEKSPLWFSVFFADIISSVPNLVVLLVGRPASQPVVESLERALPEREDLPEFQKRSFEWSGLKLSLCEGYFTHREEFKQLAQDLAMLGIEVSPDLRQRIWKLAQGIPFQVNLVAGLLRYLDSGDEALRRQVDELLEEIQRVELNELEDDPYLRQRFQQALVSPFVLNYKRSMLSEHEIDDAGLTSRITLLIAHVNHFMAHVLGGFDAFVLADLDDTLDEGMVQRGLDHIGEHRRTQFTFVKVFRGPDRSVSGIGLHDEMVRMLNDFAWTRLDPPGKQEPYRKQISGKLVAYYDRRCLDLYAQEDQRILPLPPAEVWEQAVVHPEGQALLLARVFHSIYQSFDEGWNWAYNLSERIFRRTPFDALLYDSAEEYIRTMPKARQDPIIQAKMNVWKAGAYIARNQLSDARELLEASIAIWTEQHRSDVAEVTQLERNSRVLEQSRLGLLREQREQEGQFEYVQMMIDNFDKQLARIKGLILAKVQFKDLERAYTSLGFTYRLQGKWEKAIGNYRQALRYSRWLGDLNSIAELANNLAHVYLLWGNLTQAAQYGQIGASIRRHLGARMELGHSYRVLGMINWRVGNTYESKTYLNRARNCYENEPAALALLDLYEGYTYYRIGDTAIGRGSLVAIPGFGGVPPMRSYALLEQAREALEQYGLKDDLAWTYNVLSRAYRRDDEFEKAEEYANHALTFAQAPLRIAEAHLSLCMLYYRWGMRRVRQGDKQGAQQEFEKVDVHYEKGFKLAEDGQFVALLSVYEGVKGNVEYERGADDPVHYEAAFRHYLQECQIAARNKALRFERALNEVVADRLARMPFDLAMRYADMLAEARPWRKEGLQQEHRKIKDEIDELKKFLGLPEKRQLDEMEERFKQHIRLGDYRQALDEAQKALQQVDRYNWSIDTIRVLVKVAQAHRKLGQYTGARRYCKQALLIAKGIMEREENIELIKERAHADFTMGRILWEIGNTAEAATHFRLAREEYLAHLNHEDLGVAREMREGLARSVQYEGFMRFRIGDLQQALAFVDWAEAEYRDMKNWRRVAKALNLKARIYRDRDDEGDVEAAHVAVEEALQHLDRIKDKYAIAECYLTFMILEYQESRREQKANQERFDYLDKAETWYRTGVQITRDNNYTLLLAVYEGVLGNVLFDRLRLEARGGEQVRLEPAFDQFLEECRWGAHFEKRRFFRSLDLLMQRLSLLNSDEVRYYVGYMRDKWAEYDQEGKLPSQAGATSEYVDDMRNFCDLVEEFSEYIAS